MSMIVRMIVVLTLAVFAAGSVAHAAGSTVMDVEMAAVQASDMGMTDCDPCGGEDEAAAVACDPACSTGGFASLGAGQSSAVVLAATTARPHAYGVRLSGLASLPLKHPPRFIL